MKPTNNAFFMNAKFNSKCSETGAAMYKGDRIAWNPTTRKAYGATSSFYANLIKVVNERQRANFEAGAAPDSCVSEFEHNLRNESNNERSNGF